MQYVSPALGSHSSRPEALTPEMEIALRSAARPLYPSDPYHNFSHAEEVARNVLELDKRCHEFGIRIDLTVAFVSALLHDAAHHIDPVLLGYDFSEELSSELAMNLCRKLRFSDSFAHGVGRTILATNPEVLLETLEQQVIRAADLQGITADFEKYVAQTHALWREYSDRRNANLSFQDFLPIGLGYLARFLWPMIALTPRAYDESGRSEFHLRALANIIGLVSSTYVTNNGRVRVVVEHLSSAGPQILSDFSTPTLYVGISANECIRKFGLISVQEQTKKSPNLRFGFLVPGSTTSIPLPNESCDEIHALLQTSFELEEAIRILKPGGLLVCPVECDLREMGVSPLKFLHGSSSHMTFQKIRRTTDVKLGRIQV
jgi:SAM-dependent methyltransferase